VYNNKGFGFTEPLYQECLQHEFVLEDIPFVTQPEIPLTYKGLMLSHKFRPDFICFEKIILDIKSVSALTDAHRSQTLNYLHATQSDLGLLVNFGQFPKLVLERLACNRRNAAARNGYEIRGSQIADL
jgi:GxxExxY protein